MFNVFLAEKSTPQPRVAYGMRDEGQHRECAHAVEVPLPERRVEQCRELVHEVERKSLHYQRSLGLSLYHRMEKSPLNAHSATRQCGNNLHYVPWWGASRSH